jgi:hypothetical protein
MDSDLCQLWLWALHQVKGWNGIVYFFNNGSLSALKDLNTGFDSPLIRHFSAEDFFTVIDRCERLNVEIIGIEVFSPNIELLGIEISPEPGFGWARRFVEEFQEQVGVTFSATYEVTDLADRR